MCNELGHYLSAEQSDGVLDGGGVHLADVHLHHQVAHANVAQFGYLLRNLDWCSDDARLLEVFAGGSGLVGSSGGNPSGL